MPTGAPIAAPGRLPGPARPLSRSPRNLLGGGELVRAAGSALQAAALRAEAKRERRRLAALDKAHAACWDLVGAPTPARTLSRIAADRLAELAAAAPVVVAPVHNGVGRVSPSASAAAGGDPDAGRGDSVSAADLVAGADLGRLEQMARDNEARRRQVRGERHELREVLWRVSSVPSVMKCGRAPVGVHVEARGDRSGAYWSGLHSCGRLWLCPVCAGKIRARRTEELEKLMLAHTAAGGAVYHATHTGPHYFGEDLEKLRRGVTRVFRRLLGGDSYRKFARKFGVVGYVRTLEATHGANGWHPHIHCAWLLASPLDAERLEAFHARNVRVWCDRFASEFGDRRPLEEHQRITHLDAKTLAAYVSKFALEITRGDLKSAQGKGLAPFQILARLAAATDEGERERLLMLWHEWERGITGARMITFSRGLKARYGVDEIPDEEIAADEGAPDDGDAQRARDAEARPVRAIVEKTAWRRLRDARVWDAGQARRRPARVVILEAIEDGRPEHELNSLFLAAGLASGAWQLVPESVPEFTDNGSE